MKKVLLSEEVLKDLELFLKKYGNDFFIESVVNKSFSFSFKSLKQISVSDAAKIISIGYELKKVPIQELSEIYKESFFKYMNSNGEESKYAFGFANGIKLAVEKLGLELMVID
jgi:hypothetical protein